LGFLTDTESASLRITNMILHVVGEDGFTPEPARQVEHAEFFIERIRNTDVSAVYGFDPASQTKAQIERIATRADAFEPGAQALSREFSRLHVTSSREGAFFIFELSVEDPAVRIYSLIKYDFREAIEQSDTAAGSLLRRIVNAFIADKKAIQKSALVRVENGIAEAAVSARDRVKQAPEIGDYFAAFLHVVRTRDDVELNQKVLDVLRDTLTESKETLPDRNVPRALAQAKEVLRNRQEINEDAIVDAVLAAAGNPEDERSRSKLQTRTRRKIRTAKLDGLTFPPNRQIFRRPALRRLKTTEGVVLYYPDDANGATVRRETRPAGGEKITIETARVTEDEIVRDSARSAA